MWVFTLRPSLFLVGIVFQFWLLSITFDAFLHLILQFFFLLDSITCRHFLSIHRCSESLRRWLDVFWFGFFRFSSSSDVIQIFLNRLSVSTVDFSDHFTACEFILRISLFPVSVEAFSDLRNLVMLHDVEVALVSSVDHGSDLLKAFYSHRKTQIFCQGPRMRSIKTILSEQ